MEVSDNDVRASNWAGAIPMVITLAPTSLSSPTMPAPLHVLLSRHSFLHVGLEDAVRRLHSYAPPSFSFPQRVVVEEPETTTSSGADAPTADGEEGATSADKEEDNTDTSSSATPNTSETNPASKPPYPICWFEDEATGLPLRWQFFAGVLFDSHRTNKSSSIQGNSIEDYMPWKVRLHFTNYPHAQLLSLETPSASGNGVLTTVERTFKNSLKQSLVLQHGNNKVALNMTKQSHQRLWESIVTSKYAVYQPIHDDHHATISSNLVLLPIRLLVGPSKPVIQQRCDDLSMTLGQLLHSWAPKHFQTDTEPLAPTTSWRVAGVVPPLTTKLVDLWQALCHPDGFLYISVTTS